MSTSVSPLGQTNNAQIISLPSTTTAYTLSTAQSGSIVQLNAIAAACTITLPPIASSAGFNCRIVVGTALGAAGAITITTAAASALIYATVINGTTTTTGVTRTQVLVAVNAPVGVNLEFTCDGNSYMCNGRSTTNTIITFNA